MLGRLAKTVALGAGGYLVARYFQQTFAPEKQSGTSSVIEFIDVDVPVERAYNQWTQFEEFPKFMSSVEEIRQIDDKTLHWTALVDGKRKEWDAEISEQIPDERIAWHSVSGARNAGVVTFHKISDTRSRITLQLDYEPETAFERIGDKLAGAVKTEARRSLQSFKTFIEGRGAETGAWREAIPRH